MAFKGSLELSFWTVQGHWILRSSSSSINL